MDSKIFNKKIKIMFEKENKILKKNCKLILWTLFIIFLWIFLYLYLYFALWFIFFLLITYHIKDEVNKKDISQSLLNVWILWIVIWFFYSNSISLKSCSSSGLGWCSTGVISNFVWPFVLLLFTPIILPFLLKIKIKITKYFLIKWCIWILLFLFLIISFYWVEIVTKIFEKIN